jgi:hypothetical protein
MTATIELPGVVLESKAATIEVKGTSGLSGSTMNGNLRQNTTEVSPNAGKVVLNKHIGVGEVQNPSFAKHMEGRRIFVSNLSFETEWKYLKDHMR